MLELRDLDAFYGQSQILHGISLSLAQGARVAVIGRNGAGKSTLLKCIMNAGPTVRGTLRIDGHDLGQMPHFRRVRAGLALVPEDRRIFSHMTVAENLELAVQGASRTKAFNADTMIAYFPALRPLRKRYGHQLSGGQQQLLAIARGFMPRPRLLLLDEPTEGVAPVLVEHMVEVVNALCAETGGALLLSEQNIRFARGCTDYVHVIDAGILAFSGSWEDFDANPDIRKRHLAV